MKRFGYILAMLFGLLFVGSACSDDDDDTTLEVDEVWKAQNEDAFAAKKQDPEFQQLESQSGAGYILYKVLKQGESTEPIYYTSQVEVYYKGTFIDGTVFDDGSFEHGAPSVFAPSGVVDGFGTALQHMHPGDRWEIWIPQQMGYGSVGSTSGTVTILPYTTLIFDLEVVRVVEP